MVFPFKHPLGWFLLLAALGLVGCASEETSALLPYVQPPVACGLGQDPDRYTPPEDNPETDYNDGGRSPGSRWPYFFRILDHETQTPATRKQLLAMYHDNMRYEVYDNQDTTKILEYYSLTYNQTLAFEGKIYPSTGVSFPDNREPMCGIMMLEFLDVRNYQWWGFQPVADTIRGFEFNVWNRYALADSTLNCHSLRLRIYPNGLEEKSVYLHILDYTHFPEHAPDPCYWVYFYQDGELIYKSNDVWTQPPLIDLQRNF